MAPFAEIWGNRGGIARNPDNEVNGGVVGAKLETCNEGGRWRGLVSCYVPVDLPNRILGKVRRSSCPGVMIIGLKLDV